jgi:hypothetical protein
METNIMASKAARLTTKQTRNVRTLLSVLTEMARLNQEVRDMTVGRLQALLGVALYNASVDQEPLIAREIWKNLGQTEYSAYGSFTHHLRMLSNRPDMKDASGETMDLAGLISLDQIHGGDYRGKTPVLTLEGYHLVAGLSKEMDKVAR